MKTSELLMFAGLGIGGYYLYNKLQNKEDNSSSGGGITIIPGGSTGLGDISGLINSILGSLGGGGGFSGADIVDLFKGLGGSASSGLDLDSFLKMIAGAGTIAGAGESAIKKVTETGNDLVQKLTALFNNPAKAEVPGSTTQAPETERTLNKAANDNAMSELRSKIAGELTGVGGAYLGSKLAMPIFEQLVKFFPRLAETFAPKLVAGASGIGVPVAIAWTGADVLATFYEWASGHNVAGNWLGWGELLGETSWGRALGFKREVQPVDSTFLPLRNGPLYNYRSETWTGEPGSAIKEKILSHTEIPTTVGKPGPNAYKDIPKTPEIPAWKSDPEYFYGGGR